MLPAAPCSLPQLREVLRSCLASVSGQDDVLDLPPVRQAIVVLVDGLGLTALRERSGHARLLSARATARGDRAFSGFPSTTAAALASLTTGEPSGRHGLVGYTVLNPGTGEIMNQLTGWGPSMDPDSWQRATTVFERAVERGIEAIVVGPARYAASGLTSAVLRGGRYVGAKRMVDRFAAVREALSASGPAIAYVYIPELDAAGHADGVASAEWTVALEELDSALARFERDLRPDQGVLVTADHGMVDVPHAAHILFDTSPELIDGVELVGGEPRCLQLYAREGAAESVLAAWQASESGRAWVVGRDEAIADGWFGGPVDPEVRARIGDVLVAARKRVAYYDSRIPGQAGRSMIGQHGSWTDEETIVPLIRLGAFAR